MTQESQHHDALAEHAQGVPQDKRVPEDKQGDEIQPTQAPTPGQTAGLPGANADPRTRRVADDETAPTTLMGDVAEE